MSQSPSLRRVTLLLGACALLIACAPAGPKVGSQHEPSPYPRVPLPAELHGWALDLFPEAYPELATVGYENFGDDFVPAFVTVVVADRHFGSTLTPAALEVRLSRVRPMWEQNGWALCPALDVGPAEEFGWHTWPDKRARRLTLRFHVGC